MFEKYFEQTENYFRPMNEIWALQVQAAESMVRTNSTLVSELWRGGLTLAQSLPAQKGLDDALELHQKFWESLSERVQHAAGENKSLLTDVNQKIADVMHSKVGAASARTTPAEMVGGQASPRVVSQVAAAALKDVVPETPNKGGDSKKSTANGSDSGRSSAKSGADNKSATVGKGADKSSSAGEAKSTSMAKSAESMAKSAESTAKSAGSAKSANAGKGAGSKASGPTPAKTDNSKPQSTQPGKAGSH